MLYRWRLVTRLRMSSETSNCMSVPFVVLNAVCVVANSMISRNATGRMIACENSNMKIELASAHTSTIMPFLENKPKRSDEQCHQQSTQSVDREEIAAHVRAAPEYLVRENWQQEHRGLKYRVRDEAEHCQVHQNALVLPHIGKAAYQVGQK